MLFTEKTVQRIYKKYQNAFEELEHYDRTREKLWVKKRLDITLKQRIIRVLKELSKSTGKPVSYLIEEAVKKQYNI